MNIVVAARCLNEARNIDRFLQGYSFADHILVSDGGSTDGSLDLLKGRKNVTVIKFDFGEIINGEFWNTDSHHFEYLISQAKSIFHPDFILFDDVDDVPNLELRKQAREIIETCGKPQINAFRLYMWGNAEFFPKMNGDFHPDYLSMWGWNPNELDVHADTDTRHLTLTGLTTDFHRIMPPLCLLHRSWNPSTIQAKIDRYNALDMPHLHPLEFAGEPQPLPDFAVEY